MHACEVPSKESGPKPSWHLNLQPTPINSFLFKAGAFFCLNAHFCTSSYYSLYIVSFKPRIPNKKYAFSPLAVGILSWQSGYSSTFWILPFWTVRSSQFLFRTVTPSVQICIGLGPNTTVGRVPWHQTTWQYTGSPFVPCVSWRAQSGGTSFGRRVWFIESHIVSIIFFYLLIYLLIYSWYKRCAVIHLNN